MDAVYPPTASALARGRRVRRAQPRSRFRTVPVTFAEIKEVDEDSAEEARACDERRRRPDLLEERLARQFTEFRRRRARRDALRERDPDSPPPETSAPAPAHLPRATSDPALLYRQGAPHDTASEPYNG